VELTKLVKKVIIISLLNQNHFLEIFFVQIMRAFAERNLFNVLISAQLTDTVVMEVVNACLNGQGMIAANTLQSDIIYFISIFSN